MTREQFLHLKFPNFDSFAIEYPTQDGFYLKEEFRNTQLDFEMEEIRWGVIFDTKKFSHGMSEQFGIYVQRVGANVSPRYISSFYCSRNSYVKRVKELKISVADILYAEEK